MRGSNPSQVSCSFCKKYSTVYLTSRNGFSHEMKIDSVGNVATIYKGNTKLVDFTISFCPCCGKSLRGDNPSRD